jgi:hypothetical protein
MPAEGGRLKARHPGAARPGRIEEGYMADRLQGTAVAATPYQSGELTAPVDAGYSAQHAAAVFDGSLWLIGPSGTTLTASTLQLTDKDGDALDFEHGAASEAANWSSSSVLGGGAHTTVGCGAAPQGDALYLFFNSPGTGESGALRATRWTAEGSGQADWQEPLTLAAAGNPQQGLAAHADAAVSAVPFGPDKIIVACPSVATWWGVGEEPTLYVGTFDVGELDLQDNSWQATSDIWGGPGNPTPPFGQGWTFPSFGSTISIDWFAAAPQGSDGKPVAGTPPFYLWVSLTRPDAAVTTILLPIDEHGNVTYPTTPVQGMPPGGGTTVRDPAGRIRTYNSGSGVIDVRTYSTWRTPTPPNLLPATESQPQAPSVAAAAAPTAAFYVDLGPKAGAPASFQGSDGKTYKGTAYPVYEFLAYGHDQLFCQVNRFGTAEVFPELPDSLALKPANGKEKLIIEGIIDAPLPIPQANIADFAFEDSDPDFGSVTYSATKTGATEHSVSDSWTAGFKTDAQTLKGIGPAWDISFEGGMGQVRTDGTTVSMSQAKRVPTLLDMNTWSTGHQNVTPRGALFCTIANFLWTGYRFLDADGTPIADGLNPGSSQQAPLFTTVSCRFSDAGSVDFVPYTVTPGDLHSYTPDGINARMKSLGQGDNYFQRVVEPNAYTFPDGSTYLTASWADGVTSQADFQAITSQLTESSWTLSSSVWAGESGGEGLNVFGVGWEWSFEFMEGGTYSHVASASTSEEDAWGIGLSDQFGPESATKPEHISRYVFRIYFLPAPPAGGAIKPTVWVEELAACCAHAPVSDSVPTLDPETIDTNACAWKIMFVVTSYESQDKSVSYSYPPGDAA